MKNKDIQLTVGQKRDYAQLRNQITVVMQTQRRRRSCPSNVLAAE